MSKPSDFERATLDPASAFTEPADVVADPRFSDDQKIEILRRWEYDATEQGVATEEGMPGNAASLLEQILSAMAELGAEIDNSRRPPTKQGGLDRDSVKRKR